MFQLAYIWMWTKTLLCCVVRVVQKSNNKQSNNQSKIFTSLHKIVRIKRNNESRKYYLYVSAWNIEEESEGVKEYGLKRRRTKTKKCDVANFKSESICWNVIQF